MSVTVGRVLNLFTLSSSNYFLRLVDDTITKNKIQNDVRLLFIQTVSYG